MRKNISLNYWNSHQSPNLIDRDSRDARLNEHAQEFVRMLDLQSSQLNGDPHLDLSISSIPFLITSYEKCKIHPRRPIEYVCLTDKEKICADCMAFGNHKSGGDHRIQRLEFLKESIDPQIKCFEDLSSKLYIFSKNAEKTYEGQRKATLNMIQDKFKELRYLISKQEAEFNSEINSFYDQEIEKLRKQTRENSIAKQVILQKISEYNKIMQIENSFELLEEDFSGVIKTIQRSANAKTVKKIDQKLQEMKLKIDSTLTGPLSAMKKVAGVTKDLALLHEEIELKLDEELSSRKELEKYEFISKNFPSLTPPLCLNQSAFIAEENFNKLIEGLMLERLFQL